ncbi:MAG TPA: U32 family peptidase [Spirochaetota bacterium]|nr:U32 family peptidase [Spirochaetota bacterium]
MRKIELLAPAKNIETGIAAVNCGADAVYIGPEKFGARSAAGNSLGDIEKLIIYSHKYYARVYATVNTILYENELEEARKTIFNLYNAGIDGIIFQDMGILEMDLPPVPLHASTQCDNYDIEKIKFLDRIGIPRVVLARELSIDELREIRKEVNCELEFFIHGALCVSMSGRCYMSAAYGGRSANRGECAQPCRKRYTLTDSNGKIIPAGRYPLSLKDLNRTEYIGELVDAGIDSFKIEGRLKDVNYVRNIVSHYRLKIDEVLEGRNDLRKLSSGVSVPGFTPDPERTFNRGYTEYFTNGRTCKVLSPHTPKSSGKRIGVVQSVENNRFSIDGNNSLNAGDGIFFFKRDGSECGTRINRVDDVFIYPLSIDGIYEGAEIFRNSDALFEKVLETAKSERRITADILLQDTDDGFKLVMKDSDGNTAVQNIMHSKEKSMKESAGEEQLLKHLRKLGNTIFTAGDITVDFSENWFVPVSILNEARRICADKLEAVRCGSYIRQQLFFSKTDIQYPYTEIDYRWNVSNSFARKFYERHGVSAVMESFETGSRTGTEDLMTTKMCLKYENGLCPGNGGKNSGYSEPFILSDGSRKFRIIFDCSRCIMMIKPYD